jgi:hypothetical protein
MTIIIMVVDDHQQENTLTIEREFQDGGDGGDITTITIQQTISGPVYSQSITLPTSEIRALLRSSGLGLLRASGCSGPAADLMGEQLGWQVGVWQFRVRTINNISNQAMVDMAEQIHAQVETYLDDLADEYDVIINVAS